MTIEIKQVGREDDLIARLCDGEVYHYPDGREGPWEPFNPDGEEAAARIAELERERDEARSAYRDAADGWESASKSLSACQVANSAAATGCFGSRTTDISGSASKPARTPKRAPRSIGRSASPSISRNPTMPAEREAVVAWLRRDLAAEATRMMLMAGLPGGTRTQRVKNRAFADGVGHAITSIIAGIERGDHLEDIRNEG